MTGPYSGPGVYSGPCSPVGWRVPRSPGGDFADFSGDNRQEIRRSTVEDRDPWRTLLIEAMVCAERFLADVESTRATWTGGLMSRPCAPMFTESRVRRRVRIGGMARFPAGFGSGGVGVSGIVRAKARHRSQPSQSSESPDEKRVSWIPPGDRPGTAWTIGPNRCEWAAEGRRKIRAAEWDGRRACAECPC
jgi:hypothetical protein